MTSRNQRDAGLKFSRRSLLKATAALAAGGAAKFSLAGDAEASAPAFDTKYNFCGICSANCAMLAHVQDGRVVRLRGNPDDQVAEGRLCVKGYAAHKDLYDPDRLKYPMMRTNQDKGPGVDPGWVRVSWEEAFDKTAEAFKATIDSYGPEGVMFVSRRHDWIERLRKGIGSPNVIQHHSTCFTTYTAVWRAAVGTGNRPFMLDVANANYILSFGWDQPAKAKNMSGRHFSEAVSRGAKVVYIDPRLTATGRMADEWIPIKPGTDLAVMLAMIKIIIEEGLYDRAFVEESTEGLDKLREGVQEYSPEWAESKSGVPAETIVRIAREFGSTRPALIPNHKRDAGGPNYANSWRTAFCKLILNALVGSIDRVGGQVIPRTPSMPSLDAVFPPPDYPPMRPERIDGFEKHPIIGPTERGDFSTITEALLDDDPYPVRAALVRKHNILAFPNAPRFTEALKKLDFLAVVDVWPSEMVQMADVVFPEPYFLETTGLGARAYHAFYPQVAMREPVVEPLYDTKGLGAIIEGIAEAMGLDVLSGVSGGEVREAQLDALGTTMDEIRENGGLWTDEQPFVPRTSFGTPSGKLELYSTVLEDNGYDPLPYWQPKREEPSDEYPFYMLITRAPMHKMTQTQNNRLLMELNPENTVTMNASRAREMGLREGDLVWVESRANRIRLRVELSEGIRPDCVSIEHGFGHWSQELSIAHTQGANEGDLIPNLSIGEMLAVKDPGAGSLMTDFCVKVYRT